MRTIYGGIVIALLSLLALTACEKDQETLLIDGVWSFQSMTTDSDESNIMSLVSLGQALLTGASIEFQEGGGYILDSPLVDDPTTGEWRLIGDDQLILDPDNDASSTSRIETLSKDRLSYSEDFVDGEMNSYKVTTTWTK